MLGNYIGIAEPPKEMFGKIMSISDELMWRYFELLSLSKTSQQIRQMIERAVSGELNPRDCKIDLALELIARFHGPNAALEAREDFERRFAHGQLPAEIPEQCLVSAGPSMAVSSVLKAAGLTASTSDARRMIQQGAVKIDGAKISNVDALLGAGAAYVIQVGKLRIARVTIDRQY